MKELFDFDRTYGNVIGTDEAGRGPAAGGVFAAAVYFPEFSNSLITDLERLIKSCEVCCENFSGGKSLSGSRISPKHKTNVQIIEHEKVLNVIKNLEIISFSQ